MAEGEGLSVSLRRSGGILPGQVLGSSVREEELEPREAEELRALVEAADPASLAACSPITGPGADMYQYELTVTQPDNERRIVVAGRQVPNELRPLVDFMEQRAAGRAP